jgi:DNA-binding NarL/FixJ family response regulator
MSDRRSSETNGLPPVTRMQLDPAQSMEADRELWERIEALLHAFGEESNLSVREHAVLVGIVKGLAPKELATELDCTRSTVDVYCHRLYNKTGTRSRYELMARVVVLMASQLPPLRDGRA